MANVRVSGPYDQYRDKVPTGVDPERWNAFVDQENLKSNTTPHAPGSPLPGSVQEFEQDAQGVFNQPVAAPVRGSTPESVNRANITNQINDWTTRNLGQSQQAVNNLQGQINLANQIDSNAITGLAQQQNWARGQYGQIAGNVGQLGTDYNKMSADLYGGYFQGQAGLNAQDQATLGNYMNETAPLMQQLQARGSDPADVQRQMDAYNLATGIANGSYDYTAAQYASNPADIARQQQMYNTLYGVGQGSLDYTASQYYSDPADIARQQDAYDTLDNIGRGALNYKSQAAQAYADPQDLANQRKALSDIQNDLANGSADQREVMQKYKDLSNPQVTAQERFLSELARREFEAGDKSSRQAVSENLAMRGLRSGGQQIAMQQAAREQLAQDRLLKELGIQAQAVDRSMTALGGWGNQANAIRSSDQNALNMQAGLSTALRNASFDEAYKRGVGADTASANNQQTMLSGSLGAAQQSNAIRNADDAVGTFNVGQQNVAKANNQATRLSGYQGAAAQSNAIRNSNDQVGMFNTNQTNVAQANNQATRVQGAQLSASQSNAIRNSNDTVRMFQDTYAQNEAQRVGNLAGQRAQTSLATTGQIGQRQQDAYTSGQTALNDAYNRSMNTNKAQWDATSANNAMSKDYFDAVTGGANNSVNRANTAAITGSNVNAVASDQLIRQLGINNDQWAIAQEHALSQGY